MLLTAWPRLAEAIPWMRLGAWPSPLQSKVVRGREVLFKREDLSAEGYAGNKIRPLEMVFGAARAAGLQEIWSTGAYGSNHALAAAIHARRQGFGAGAVLWPQPWSQTAEDNLVVTASVCDEIRWARSVVAMPATALWVRGTRRAWVMPPGAATPVGAVGHAGAALELGAQLGGREIEAIVLPIGSTCTTAGLLVGTALAHASGHLAGRAPRIVAVRVTPWPVTATWRVARLAEATARYLAERFAAAGLNMPEFPRTAEDFRARLAVVGDELGGGYGRPTVAAWGALAELSHVGLRLDTTYSAKAAAYLLRMLSDRGSSQTISDNRRGRIVFWATKSAIALPSVDHARIARLPRRIKGWLRHGGAIGS